MFKLNKYVFVSICVFGNAGTLYASGGKQFWNEFKLAYNTNEFFTIHIKFEQRFLKYFEDFRLHNYAPGISFKKSKYTKFELNYKYEKEKNEKNWRQEHRVEFIPILMWEWRNLKFNLRNRIEGDSSYRLREKLKLGKSINADIFVFTLFFSEELFFDFKSEELNQNRSVIGIMKKISKNLELILFYMQRGKKKNGEWGNTNVFGTKFVLVVF